MKAQWGVIYCFPFLFCQLIIKFNRWQAKSLFYLRWNVPIWISSGKIHLLQESKEPLLEYIMIGSMIFIFKSWLIHRNDAGKTFFPTSPNCGRWEARGCISQVKSHYEPGSAWRGLLRNGRKLMVCSAELEKQTLNRSSRMTPDLITQQPNELCSPLSHHIHEQSLHPSPTCPFPFPVH